MVVTIDLVFEEIADLPRCLRTSACVKDKVSLTLPAHTALHLARVIERGLVPVAPPVVAEVVPPVVVQAPPAPEPTGRQKIAAFIIRFSLGAMFGGLVWAVITALKYIVGLF